MGALKRLRRWRSSLASQHTSGPQRAAALAAVFGVLGVLLSALTSVADKLESLRWLWIVLVMLSVVVGVPAVWLASPWWQRRQQERFEKRRAEQMARGHFIPRGQGIAPRSNRHGWYFTGRTHVLQEVVAWLGAPPDSDPKARVVTGKPGSGKSAVLGRLITLSDPEYREAALQAGAAEGTVPPKGCIDVRVYARDMTVAQVVALIAEAADVQAASPDDLQLALQERGEWLTLLVDAVDEAAEADQLASQLLEPLATAASGIRLRLLVGARPHLLGQLGGEFKQLDLDDPKYLDPADLVEYVRRCLLLEGDPTIATPYRDRRALAAQVAEAVAARARPSFLVAWLVSQSLIVGDPVDMRQPDWQQQFPANVGIAMKRYLDQFKHDRARIVNLLVPLAFAEGDGLADEALWASLSSQLGTAVYTPQDVRWLLQETAASDLLEAGQVDGRLAYRLFHSALIEYLQTRESLRRGDELQRHLMRVHSCITQELEKHVPAGPNSGKDWFSADVYVRTHLATHAARAGQLDRLLDDAGFLLAADPDRLVSALAHPRDPAEQTDYAPIVSAYLLAAPLLRRSTDRALRAAYLHFTAQRMQAAGLATALQRAVPRRPWEIIVTSWQQAAARLLGHVGRVDGGRFLLGDHEAFLACHLATDITVWRLLPTGMLALPIADRGHVHDVTAVDIASINGHPHVCSADATGTIILWRITNEGLARVSSAQLDVTDTPHEIKDVALDAVGGRVIAAAEPSGLHVWRIEQDSLVSSGHLRVPSIRTVVIYSNSGRTFLVSGSRSGVSLALLEDDVVTHLDINWQDDDGAYVSVAVADTEHGPLILSVDDRRQISTIWRITDDYLKFGPRFRGRSVASCTWIGPIGDRTVAVTGGSGGDVRAWRPLSESSTPLVHREAHPAPVIAVTGGRLGGNATLLSLDESGTVLQWPVPVDPLPPQRYEVSVPHDEPANDACIVRVGDETVAIGLYSEASTVKGWRLEGQRLAPLGESARITWPRSISAATTPDRTMGLLVSGGGSYLHIYRVGAAGITPLMPPVEADGLHSATIGAIGDQILVVSQHWIDSDDEPEQLQLWRLIGSSMQPIGSKCEGYGPVAFGALDGRPVVIAARLDLVEPDERTHSQSVSGVALARVTEAGLRLISRSRYDVHQGYPTCLVLTEVGGVSFGVAAFGDGQLRSFRITESGCQDHGHQQIVGKATALASSSPGGLVAVGTVAGSIQLFKLDEQGLEPVHVDPVEVGSRVISLAVLPGGEIFTWCQHGSVRIRWSDFIWPEAAAT